jgi:transcriptional regulator with XRE-family HTH domain
MSDYRNPETLEWTMGDRLRKTRRVAGMTTDQMASAAGVSRSAINSYEHDKRTPSVRTLQRWAEVTEVPFQWLCLGGASTMWLIASQGAAA